MQPCSPAYYFAARSTTEQLYIPPCIRPGATGGQHCRSGAVLPLILASPVARTAMTLMSPLVVCVHHHEGLRRHGGGAHLMGGAVVRVVARHLHGCMVVGGLHGYRAAGWYLFYCRHTLVFLLDWPLSFSTDCREP